MTNEFRFFLESNFGRVNGLYNVIINGKLFDQAIDSDIK